MNWWKEFKEEYELGSVIELTVEKKVPPAFILFTLTEKIKGSLHISELNWNFGLCQSDYNKISVGDTLRVYIIEYDDRFKRVHLGRKLIFADSRPSLTSEWQELILKEEYPALVYEEFKNKVIVRLESGLFGTMPLVEGKSYHIGTQVRVIPISKNVEQNIIECTLDEFAESTIQQTESVIESFKESFSENEFLSSEVHLNSFLQLSNSFYWNYFSEEDRVLIKTLFDNTKNLYSKVEKGEEAIYFEFDFASSAYDDFINVISPLIFSSKVLPDGFTSKDLLVELSKLDFWYTQFEKSRTVEGFEQSITEKYFSLFNETISIYGIISDEGQFKIRNIKAKNRSESLKDKLKSLKLNYVFFINRPIIFSQFSPLNNFNKSFIEIIDSKIIAFRIYESAKIKSLDIIHEQGKDFLIFKNYLESQIDFEIKSVNNTELQLLECRLDLDIQTDGVVFSGLINGKCDLTSEDKVVISKRDEEGKPLLLGAGQVMSIKDDRIKISSSVESIELVEGGCLIKKISSTKQQKVQIDVLNQFFTNQLPLESFYNIFHNRDGIEPPLSVNLKYFNKIFQDRDNPQTKAIAKAVGNRNIVLIQGPPGTGKTTVITEIVKQLVSRGEKVLVTSQTHIAVDNVLERVKDETSIRVVRIGHQETISDFAVRYTMEEARKSFSKEIVDTIDLKIEFVRQIQAQGISDGFLREGLVSKLRLEFQNLNDFLEYTERFNIDQLSRLIDTLELWKSVISKSPKLLTGIFLRNVNVLFGTCIGIATCKELAESEICFDTVILDEAGKANISETLTAISKANKIVLVGDHKQLPPYFDRERIDYFKYYIKETKENKECSLNDSEIKNAIGISFFEYLQREGILKEDNKIMLSEQFRMHPDIGNFVSQTFYNSELKNAENTKSNVIQMPEPFNRQLIFIDTSTDIGSNESFKDGSYHNQVEAEFIVNKVIPEFTKCNISPQTYAIVTPYSKQSEKIKELLLQKDSNTYRTLEVATLDSFQGREFDIIVFSFTRSAVDKRVGFLDDARRLNVAFSRAKKKLILIGNSKTLRDRKSHSDYYYTELFIRLFHYAGNYGKVYRINQLDFKKLQSEFKVGDIVKGIITRFESYGILVNLGQGHGLIPNRELRYNSIGEARRKLVIKQEIDVQVIGISEKGVLLSCKQIINQDEGNQLHNSKIQSLAEKNREILELFQREFKVNDICEGVILKLVENNPNTLKVFVDLMYGVKGVCYTTTKNKNLKTGYTVMVRIAKIDNDKQIVRGKLII